MEEAQRGALFVSNGTGLTMCVAKGGQRHRTSFENEEAIDRLKSFLMACGEESAAIKMSKSNIQPTALWKPEAIRRSHRGDAIRGPMGNVAAE